MSDSDTDGFPNNVFGYQNQSTRVCVKGPNVNSTNIAGLNFGNNMSSMNMQRPRYAESVYEQRSMYSRREMSPMSYHSASGYQPRSYQHSLYSGAMSSQRSMYNGRSGSPMSVRTMDSNMSVTATDIALALKTMNFNKFDMRIIKDAYNKFMKGRIRKRIEKRRNLRTFLKRYRRSGDDSGDQASDSSLSSDDHRSVRSSRTAIFNDNASCRSTRTDIMDFRKMMTDNRMYRDCTDEIRQNQVRNMLPIPSSTKSSKKPQPNNTSWRSQPSKFRSGFLLPSQRFNVNQSVASLPISEITCVGSQRSVGRPMDRIHNRNPSHINKDISRDIESDQEEIFSELTIIQNDKQNNQRKRSLEEKDIPQSVKKKCKLSAPMKKSAKPNTPKLKQSGNTQSKGNDFEFAKPQLPVKKSIGVKNVKSKQMATAKSQQNVISAQLPAVTVTSPKQKEIIISKSRTIEEITSQSHPLKDSVSHSPERLVSKSKQPLDLLQEKSAVDQQQNSNEKEQYDTIHSTTDMSMRPSFIKRKLFTQKIDEAEKSGSSESLHADSPQQNIYSKIQKEKNKTRKLVTQSCLSRDLGDDSNLLDLIHKMVPADSMNLTTATNRGEIQSNKSKPNNGDKWDISAIITSNNHAELSDTYTSDDEIFKTNETKQNNTKNQGEVQSNIEKTNETLVASNKNLNQKNIKLHENVTNKNLNNNQQNKPQTKIANTKTDNRTKKAIQNHVEKSGASKKTDKINEHNQPKTIQKMPSSPRILLQKMSVEIKKVQANNDETACIETNDSSKKKAYCVKSFWDDFGSDFEETPVKKPELKGKGLSYLVNETISCKPVNTTVKMAPIKQLQTLKTSQKFVHTLQNTNKMDDTLKTNKCKEGPNENVKVNKGVEAVKVQPNKTQKDLGQQPKIVDEHTTKKPTQSSKTKANNAKQTQESSRSANQNNTETNKEKDDNPSLNNKDKNTRKQDTTTRTKPSNAKKTQEISKSVKQNNTETHKDINDNPTSNNNDKNTRKQDTTTKTKLSNTKKTQEISKRVKQTNTESHEDINDNPTLNTNDKNTKKQDETMKSKPNNTKKTQEISKPTKQNNTEIHKDTNDNPSLNNNDKNNREQDTVPKTKPSNTKHALGKSKSVNQNNTETQKVTNENPTLKTNNKINRKQDTILKVNNNTMRIRSQRTPKINTCCADHKLDNTFNDSRLCRTLRSREIDLSTSLDTSVPLSKTTLKTKKRVNRKVDKESDKENHLKTNDDSFNSSSEIQLASKISNNKRINRTKNSKQNTVKPRISDVSFTLGNKSLNQTMTRRRLKEVEKLQLGTPKFFGSRQKSPLNKKVDLINLSKRTSSRLNRSRVY